MNTRFKQCAHELRKYSTVAILGWQDSLVYRFNALIWVIYAVAPSLTVMLVWIAVYGENPSAPESLSGFDLRGMMTYYFCITWLSIAITPNPEWDIATSIRDGKITPFIVRPINYFWFQVTWESCYQVVKTLMALPGFALLWWIFRDYIVVPSLTPVNLLVFLSSSLLGFVLLLQMKFLLGISAFWLAETGGLIEIWNVLMNLLAGRLLPVALLPYWARLLGIVLPFGVIYAFPMDVLLGRATGNDMLVGLLRQITWIAVLSPVVHLFWKRGLMAYEAYGG